VGDEIFLNYGYCSDDDSGPEWSESIPKKVHYSIAATVMKRLYRFIRQYKLSNSSSTAATVQTGTVGVVASSISSVGVGVGDKDRSMDELITRKYIFCQCPFLGDAQA
jgi:hypothetical protein